MEGRTGRPRFPTDPLSRSKAVSVQPVLRGQPRTDAAGWDPAASAPTQE